MVTMTLMSYKIYLHESFMQVSFWADEITLAACNPVTSTPFFPIYSFIMTWTEDESQS